MNRRNLLKCFILPLFSINNLFKRKQRTFTFDQQISRSPCARRDPWAGKKLVS